MLKEIKDNQLKLIKDQSIFEKMSEFATKLNNQQQPIIQKNQVKYNIYGESNQKQLSFKMKSYDKLFGKHLKQQDKKQLS